MFLKTNLGRLPNLHDKRAHKTPGPRPPASPGSSQVLPSGHRWGILVGAKLLEIKQDGWSLWKSHDNWKILHWMIWRPSMLFKGQQGGPSVIQWCGAGKKCHLPESEQYKNTNRPLDFMAGAYCRHVPDAKTWLASALRKVPPLVAQTSISWTAAPSLPSAQLSASPPIAH